MKFFKTKFEKNEIVRIVKRREFSKLDNFLELFNGVIWRVYRASGCGEYKIDFEDFRQDCYAEVLKALKSFESNTYEQLCAFIKIIIMRAGGHTAKKYKNQNDYNILGIEAEDIHYLASREIGYSLENEVVNRLTIEHSNEKFIKKTLTKKECRVLEVFYFGKCPRKYESENGLKYRTFDRTLYRALKKTAKIVATKEFMDFPFLSIVPYGMILE